jgi:hypothetical protein
MRLNEASLHGWDVRVAFDPAATLSPQETATTVEQLTGPLGFMLGFLGKPEALGGLSTTVRVETADPDRVLVLVLGQKITLDDGPAQDEVGGVLKTPAEALLRLFAGRLDEAHTPDALTMTSDVVSLDQLRKVFPGI